MFLNMYSVVRLSLILSSYKTIIQIYFFCVIF